METFPNSLIGFCLLPLLELIIIIIFLSSLHKVIPRALKVEITFEHKNGINITATLHVNVN